MVKVGLRVQLATALVRGIFSWEGQRYCEILAEGGEAGLSSSLSFAL